jgi:hypothetical protein
MYYIYNVLIYYFILYNVLYYTMYYILYNVLYIRVYYIYCHYGSWANNKLNKC